MSALLPATQTFPIIDAVTLEVVRGKLEVIAEEMQFAMIRSAYSNIVKEAADASAAIFDLHGQVLAQASGIPILLGVLVPAVQNMLKKFPVSEMKAGDVYVLNDPYEGGTHLPDIVAALPVFLGRSPVALACMITHHQDVGGKTPGSIPTDATDIFQEGLRLPPLKLYDAGTANETLLSILKKNVRFPDELMGDLRAQVAACHLGAERVVALFTEHGEKAMLGCITELLDRSDTLTRAKLATLPQGRYSFSDYLDNDGIDLDRRIRIQATIEIDDTGISIDFAGSSPQVKGPFNATTPSVIAAAYFVVRAITGPEIPNNAGCYRAVRVTCPEGTILNPRSPAAVNARSLTFCLIVDVLFGALAQAAPRLIPAASYEYPVVSFGGTDPATQRPFVFYEIGCGGLGARPGADGIDVFRSKAGNTLSSPIESLELDFPLRVVSYALRRDSGGAGRWRGGLGYSKVFEVLRGELTVSHRGDRHFTSPWGLDGGQAAAPSVSVIVRADGCREEIPSKRVFTLRAGDRLLLHSAGGGGHGSAHMRSVDQVLDDVLDQKISVETARQRYGVAFHAGGEQVDFQGTGEIRARANVGNETQKEE